MSFTVFLALSGCGPGRNAQPPPSAEEASTPPPMQLRLLTRREYAHTVADLLPSALGGGASCAVDADCDVALQSCVAGTCQDDPCGIVTFQLPAAAGAHGSVHVAGSFNGWAPTVADGGWAMTWLPEHGSWVTKRSVADGQHTYKFVIDGSTWLTDPTNPATVDDGYGGANSLLEQACAGRPPGIADPTSAFPVEARPTGYPFDNAAETGVVTSAHVEQYDRAAESLAAALDLSTVLSCDPDTIGAEACARAFLTDLGGRAFRRPMTDEEQARYVSLILGQSDWETGIRAATRAMLQSPHFLYRTELGQPQPDGTFALDGYEIASALSYFLWGTMPDGALLEAAADGTLATPAGREAQALRLLEDPRARDHLSDFATQWLGIEWVPDLIKAESVYPAWDEALGEEMVAETRAFFEWVLFDGPRRYEDLLLSEATWADERLLALYGATAPSGETPGTLPPERRGLLGQGSVLAATAHSDQSSPILRGLFVRERLLCQTFATPPANVGPVPEIAADATTRERFAAHTSDPFCASCHDDIDPIGFGLEAFDGIGLHRTEEHGLTIDTTGELSGLEDLRTDQAIHPFDGATQLSEILAGSSSGPRCFATQAWRFAHGRLDSDADQASIDAVEDWLLQADGDLQEALIAIVTSPDFARRSVP